MTTLPKNILVAVDFGEASARAVTIGGELAARAGAVLRLLHAESLDVPPYFTPAQMQALEGEARANQRRAAEFLRKFGRRHTSHPVQAVVESRTAVDAILHASKDADLVVMGTHGRRGPSRWWLGSVAERVLRETATPLLVVHATAADAPPPTLYSMGLMLTAGHPGAARARGLAAAIAAAFSGTVTEVEEGSAAEARARVGADWAAVPIPAARTQAWLARVGEPLLQTCAIPVLFVPEAEGGPVR